MTMDNFFYMCVENKTRGRYFYCTLVMELILHVITNVRIGEIVCVIFSLILEGKLDDIYKITCKTFHYPNRVHRKQFFLNPMN